MNVQINLDNIPKTKNIFDWSKSIGKLITLTVNNIDYTLKIINYDSVQPRALHIEFENIVYRITPYSLCHLKCIKKLLGDRALNYIYTINEVVKTKNMDILILNTTRVYSDSRKGYEFKCLQCDNIGTVAESELKRGTGCAICCPSPRKIVANINSIQALRPDLTALLLDEYDSIKYGPGSSVKLKWKCPNCENIIINSPNKVSKRGLSCTLCGIGTSYPEKLMCVLLSELNIDYKHHKKFSWSKNKIYDFYIKDKSILIETHGIQHLEPGHERGGRSFEEEVANDEVKAKLATPKIDNYIVIDCRYSKFDFIKNNIINNSSFSKLFNLSSINWDTIDKKISTLCMATAWNLFNTGKNIEQISLEMQVSINTVKTYLRKGSEFNKCSYTPPTNTVEVVCLNNGKAFNSIAAAATYVNINKHKNHIYECLTKKRFSCGYIDGVPARWLLKEEYDSLDKSNLKALRSETSTKKVLCINANITFNSSKEAAIYAGLADNTSIVRCCNGLLKTAGSLTTTGERLMWRYI